MSPSIAKVSRFTEELKAIFPDYSFSFRCPVCLRDFTEADVIDGRLCDAHIIPAKLDGSTKTTVCAACDSRIGHEIEGPLMNYLTNLSTIYLKRGGKIRGSSKIVIGDQIYPARISVDTSKGWTIEMLDPTRSEDLVEQVRKGPFRATLLVSKSQKATNNALTAFALKAAYLAAFEHLGYKYILQRQLDWIRQVIRSPQSFGTPYKSVFLIKPYPLKGEYLLIRHAIVGFDAVIILAKIGDAGTCVILPPFELAPNQEFSGYALEDKQELAITFEVTGELITGIQLEFSSK